MAYTNAVAHNLAAIRAAHRAAAPLRARKAAEQREPDAADRVAERVRTMPTPKRQQEDW